MASIDAIEDGGPPGLAPQGQSVIACSVVAAGLSGLIVGLRFFARLSPSRLLGKEDWCILIAWLWSVAETIGMCIQAITGMGERFDTLTLNQQQTFFKWSYITIIFYNTGLAFSKVSILLLYLRILRDLNYRKACYIVLSIVTIVSLWTVISSILFCVPIQRNWDRSVPGHCLDRAAHWFANAALNIVTDFMILILPLPILPKIKQTRQQKIGLYLIFALGFFVCVVSILRIPSLITAQYSSDATFESAGIAMWSVIEFNTAIVCACLITLKPLIGRIFPRFLGSKKDVGHQQEAGSDFGNDGVPATVGSKETGQRPNLTRGLSEETAIQLNHDTFGARSRSDTQTTHQNELELAELDQGRKTISLEDGPTSNK